MRLHNILDIITDKVDKLDSKLVLVIDELPYWAEKDEGLLSVFQKYIDTRWSDKNTMLIFCPIYTICI